MNGAPYVHETDTETKIDRDGINFACYVSTGIVVCVNVFMVVCVYLCILFLCPFNEKTKARGQLNERNKCQRK